MTTQLKLWSEPKEQFKPANDNEQGKHYEEFMKFHTDNPDVYLLFKKFTFEAIQRGRKKLGVGAIIERVRWYTDIETRGGPFKLNNNYSPYYARMFMSDFPEHEGFFATRVFRERKAG